MPAKLTQEEFINKAKILLKDVNYDYSLVEYKNSTTLVKIKCVTHDYIFEQKPMYTLKNGKGQLGCKFCTKRGITNDDFIYLAKQIHGDIFNYSKAKYSKMGDNIIVICKKHNTEYSQNAQRHLLGANPCYNCNGQRPIDKAEFIRRAEEKHGKGHFSYEMIPHEFNGIHSKGSILCLKHGIIFTIDLWSHIKAGANGCPDCNKSAFITREEFLRRAKIAHPNHDFDYSLIDMSIPKNKKTKIICIKHNNIFEQTLFGHLDGKNGCTDCTFNGISKKEISLAEFIESLGFTVERTKRNLIPGVRELDAFVPDLNIAFEFNGLYFHQEKFRKKYYHYDKSVKCYSNDVRLVHIWEDDWDFKRPLVEQYIRRVLNVSGSTVIDNNSNTNTINDILEKVLINSISALSKDNTRVEKVNQSVVDSFYKDFSLECPVKASLHLGLFDVQDTLISVMSFNKVKKDYSITGFTSSFKISYDCLNSFNLLLDYFDSHYIYNRLFAVADLALNDLIYYKNDDWVFNKFLPEDFCYIIGARRVSKDDFSLNSFNSATRDLLSDHMSISDASLLDDVQKIWDAGKIRFVRNK